MAGPGGSAHVRASLEAATELWEPVPLDEVRVNDFEAIYIPGGHGCMEDLATDPISAEILTATLSTGTPLGMSCHAPAALLATGRADGTSPFAGYRVTAFSNAEERQAGHAEMAKWLLADRLANLGIDYRSGPPWSVHIEADRNVFTAQNPLSAASLATELVRVLA
ncbi:type 1 glutamine amidotransferase domain-containing protein [Nocardia stercoris]|uniref:Type 1 glutamine amidotransferase domain-containing protein n=1 Tax=Nocardia stercoris TaxID=2483361 RepID=A0A3M2LBQ6_9NOCA|nr:type 1 glutamine amidotransferase domain-containing protein [Nocardia stercoris]RMI32118.1 type 1 glutamine amidotransferase domain-containing protein [Nocardia stercoris]